MMEEQNSYHTTYIYKKDILDKCCLTEDEMNEYLKQTEHLNPKEEHDHLYYTMSNETRRELINL